MRKHIKITTVKSRISPKERQEAEKQRKLMDSSPIFLILYIIGLTGMMYSFVESGFLAFPMFFVVASFTAVLSTLLWYFYFYRNKQFFYVIGVYCVIALLLGAWQIPSMSKVFKKLITSAYYGSPYDENISIGILVLFILGIVFVLFAMEFVLRRHVVLFLLSAALIIAGPLFELKVGPVTIIAVVIFQFGFFILNMTDSKLKKTFVYKNHAKTAAISTTIIAVLFLAAYIPGFIIQTIFEKQLFLAAYQADSVIKDTVDYITGNYGSDGINGSVSRGNLRQTGESILTLELSDIPQDRLYLRGYTGSYYYDDYWEPAFGYIGAPQRDSTNTQSISPYDTETPEPVYQYGEDDYAEDDYYSYEIESEYYPFDEEISRNVLNSTIDRYRGLISDFVLGYFDGIQSTDTFQVYFNNDLNEVSIHGIDEYDYPQFFLTLSGPDMTQLIKSGEDISEHQVTVSVYDSEYISEMIVQDGSPVYEPRVKVKERPDDGRYDSFTKFTTEDALSSYYSTQHGYTFIYDIEKHPGIMEIFNYPEYTSDTSTSDITGDIIYNVNSPMTNETNIRITPINSFYQNIYVPYLCKYDQAEISQRDSSESSQQSNTGYTNFFIAQSSVNNSGWWELAPNYNYLSEQYQKETDEYMYYTDLPRLLELCNSQSLGGDVNEVTTFILYTLQNNARYTTTPGSVPWRKNTLEYFLFDNHRGFCVHYASTAVNMYHMLGIPARYVAGFVVNPDQLTQTDNSLYPYSATVTDYSAHAWVEIYLKDYGWVVVDVTPDENNRMHAFYPGYDEEEMNRIMKKHGWTFSTSEQVETDGDGAAAIGGDIGVPVVAAAFLLPVLAVMALVLIFPIRRSIVIKNSASYGCRRSFDRMIKALHYAGMLKDKNGSEIGFAGDLSSAAECIDPTLAESIVRIMEEDNFSPGRVNEEQTQTIRDAGNALRAELYEKLPLHKKIIYKYVKALI